MERQGLLGVVTAADHHPGAAALRLGRELACEAALADAGFAEDRDHASVCARRFLERLGQLRELQVAADERRVGGERRYRLLASAGLPLREELAIERARLSGGLHGEIASERADTDLLLTQGRDRVSGRGVQAHQLAVHRLVERVEREAAAGGLERAREVAVVCVVRDQPRETVAHERTQPLAMADDPVLEGRLVDGEAAQEVAPIARDGGGEGFRLLADDVTLELRYVDDDVGAQRQGRRIGVEDAGGGTERLLEHEERLAEVVARRRRVGVAPQERGGILASDAAARGHGEIGEERLRFPGGEAGDTFPAERNLEATQKLDAVDRHDGWSLARWGPPLDALGHPA